MFRPFDQWIELGTSDDRLEPFPERRRKLQRQSQIRVARRKRDNLRLEAGLDAKAPKEGWKLTSRIEVASRRFKALVDQLDQPPDARRIRIHPPRAMSGSSITSQPLGFNSRL
jgi:hypothetical protein